MKKTALSPAAALSALSADHGPAGAEDSTVEPASSVENEDCAAEPAPPAEHKLDHSGGEAADDDPGGGSINPTEDDSAPIPNRLEHSEEFLIEFTLRFCDWADFASYFEFDCGVG